MSDKDFDYVSEKYSKIEKAVKFNGSSLFSPIMNLSFLALLVIPELKISDKGLFDFNSFSYIDLFE
jgi:adenine deaminase